MLINSLYHPLFHDTSRMWSMYIDIITCRIVFKSHTRSRCGSLVMFVIAKVCQQTQSFLIRKVLWLRLELLN